MNNGNYILIADSHLQKGEEEPFFDMLEKIRRYQPAGVIFLGDIFELWIALNGYESDIHERFLQWCREAKKHFERVAYLLETHKELMLSGIKLDISFDEGYMQSLAGLLFDKYCELI